MTIHKAQGLTADEALVLATDDLYQEAGYTALSRARLDTRVYVVADDFDDDPNIDLSHAPSPGALPPVTCSHDRWAGLGSAVTSSARSVKPRCLTVTNLDPPVVLANTASKRPDESTASPSADPSTSQSPHTAGSRPCRRQSRSRSPHRSRRIDRQQPEPGRGEPHHPCTTFPHGGHPGLGPSDSHENHQGPHLKTRILPPASTRRAVKFLTVTPMGQESSRLRRRLFREGIEVG